MMPLDKINTFYIRIKSLSFRVLFSGLSIFVTLFTEILGQKEARDLLFLGENMIKEVSCPPKEEYYSQKFPQEKQNLKNIRLYYYIRMHALLC